MANTKKTPKKATVKKHSKRSQNVSKKTVEVTETPKRKRGRPRKSEAEKKLSQNVRSQNVRNIKKKDTRNDSEVKVPKKRGRKPKSKNLLPEVSTENVRTLKFLGYCPECSGMVTSNDYEENRKTIFVCIRCNYRGKVKEVLDTRNANDDNRPKTKKEFLESTILVEDHWIIPNTTINLPEDLKPKEEEDEWD